MNEYIVAVRKTFFNLIGLKIDAGYDPKMDRTSEDIGVIRDGEEDFQNFVTVNDKNAIPGDPDANLLVERYPKRAKAWPLREDGKTVDQHLLDEIRIILSFGFRERKTIREIFKTIIIKEKISGPYMELFQICYPLIINSIKKGVDQQVLNEIHNVIIKKSLEQLQHDRETPGRRASINAILQLDCIDKEIVAQFNPDGTVTIPNRFNIDLTFSDPDIKACGLDPIKDMIEITKDKDILGEVFEKSIRPTLEDFVDDIEDYKKKLINILINETSINMVQNKAFLCRGWIPAHPIRRNGENELNQIWIGGLTLSSLSELEENGIKFLARLMLEKGKHFMTEDEEPKHGRLVRYPNGLTNIHKTVEHDEIFMKRLDNLAEGLETQKEKGAGEKELHTFEHLREKRKRLRNLLLKGRWKRSQDKLLASIETILEDFDKEEEKNMDEICLRVFKELYELDELTPGHWFLYNQKEKWKKHLSPKDYAIAKNCKEVIEENVRRMSKKRFTTHENVFELIENIGDVLEFFLDKINPEHQECGNMLLHHYIDKEMVVRVTHDGQVYIPSRIEAPLIIGDDELEERGLKPIVDYIKRVKSKNNREEFITVFKERLYERFANIKWNDKKIMSLANEMIDIMLNKASIDIVIGRSPLKRGYTILHARAGRTNPILEPGVWVGEYILRELIEKKTIPLLARNGRENDKFFIEILEEEAQHFIGGDKVHDELKIDPETGKDNFDIAIWHPQEIRDLVNDLAFDILDKKAKERGISWEKFQKISTGLKLSLPYARKTVGDTLIDALRISTYNPYAALMNAVKTFNDFKKSSESFISKSKEDGIASICAIDEALPMSIKLAIIEDIKNLEKETNLDVKFVFSKKYKKEDYGKHFLFYIGTTVPNIPVPINSKYEKAVLLLGDNIGPILETFTTLHFRMARRFLMGYSITEHGEINVPYRFFDMQYFFSNINNLSDDIKESLLEDYKKLEEAKFRISA